MFPGDMPSYSPPSRSFFTPPLPPEYQNPFADKPTLRGTNSESSVISSGTFTNRRPIPPPSLMPGHERIPIRPPDLVGSNTGVPVRNNGKSAPPDQPSIALSNTDNQKKKALNTPMNKSGALGSDAVKIKDMHNYDSDLENGTDISMSSGGNGPGLHFPSISRILSGSNGRKEDIPEVLLRAVTVRPNIVLVSSTAPHINEGKLLDDLDDDSSSNDGYDDSDMNGDDDHNDDEFKLIEEPKTQPKIKSETVRPDHSYDGTGTNDVYSTQIVQRFDNANNDRNYITTTQSIIDHNSNIGVSRHHPASSSSSSSLPPSPKLATWTVAWNIHVYLSAILFTILAVYSIFKMIFYDKLTHLFNQSYFISIHLILILICLSRIFYLCYDAYNIHLSFNNFLSEILLNIPSTLLTVTFSILILFLLIRSLNNKNNRYSPLIRPLTIVIGCGVHICLCITLHWVENKQNKSIYNRNTNVRPNNVGNQFNHPQRVLSLICQIIYIFICLSLGFLYLYLYRILKRVLRNKSQNYIHGYQNLSYAIHITIATALLFILLASLQIYGAISISTIRPLISTLNSDIDWLQWGYQFSLRLIEIAIITLLSWVAGLKTGASTVLQREKDVETHNVSGFALFPCTSSSSQEHFETDYPAVCNANTNLHTYTLRTGKPIYDDHFALNDQVPPQITSSGQQIVPQPTQYDANTQSNNVEDYLNDSGNIPDHYENPNFELARPQHIDNCYSEPVGTLPMPANHNIPQGYDFQNFERPNFDRPNSRTEFRASKNLKAMKSSGIDRTMYENPERRSSNSVQSRNAGIGQNSFDRRVGVRKSGTLNNIGGIHSRVPTNQVINANRTSGAQTLSSSRSSQDYHNLQRATGGRTSGNMNKKDRHNRYHIDEDEYHRNNDNSSGSDPGGPQPQARLVYETDPTQQSSSGDSATSGSMLVAEHGFVRFRALDSNFNGGGSSSGASSVVQSNHHPQHIPSNINLASSIPNHIPSSAAINEKRFNNT